MKRYLLLMLLAGSWMVASPALALYNLQLLGGNRSSSFDAPIVGSSGDSLSGKELRFAAHIDLIPSVPLGLGLGYSQTSFGASDNMQIKKFDGTDIDLEIETWLPIPGSGFVPYAKFAYTVAGKYTMEHRNFEGALETTYKPTGGSIRLGFKYEFIHRLGVMAEIEAGKRKLQFDKSNLDLAPIFKLKDNNQDSQSILIGAQAGF